MTLSYDLHMHSCLSPCGDNDMTPNNIVNMASLIGLDIIAVSDHNSALNLPAVFKAAGKINLLVIPAIEVCTSEEVHVLCLFEALDNALQFSDYIHGSLPDIKNSADIFGEQLILNENDEIVGHEDKLLINALTLSLDKLMNTLPAYDGIAIPAHVDKTSNSIISNLGFIPPEYNFSCIEQKSKESNIDFIGKRIYNSDAHYLEHINEPINHIEVSEKSIKAVIEALK